MSKDWQVEISDEQKYEEAKELLTNDFQYYLADAIAPAQGYEFRNLVLKKHIDSINENPNHLKFALLGELLYQWAENEASLEVERNHSPFPRFG